MVWYEADENAVKFASEDHTLTLEKTEFKLVIPVKSKNLLKTEDLDVEEELEGFYLQGHGEAVLVVFPTGDRIGFIFTKEELRHLVSRISTSNSPEEYLLRTAIVTEDLSSSL